MKTRVFLALLLISANSVFGSAPAQAQAVEVTEETTKPKTKKSGEIGTEAARKYFSARETKKAVEREPVVLGDRYLALTVGTFISEDVYKWGNGQNEDVGQLNAGVTYKMGEWKDSMDLMFKADITTYKLVEGRAVKLSLIPAITFPDFHSGFPLYFGGGAGLGVFFKQIEDESSLSFDYTVFAGARFFDLFENMGLLFEVGVKNHILLLSDGQFNGVYVNIGSVFNF